MSASTNKESSNTPTNRFTFQYFNKEIDVGIVNEQGECVRKKKKPGRKSNPLSQQEKRAKNRLAQKVFREREQQRKKEKGRQQCTHDEEIQKLKNKLAIAQFESKYLKACVLHLMLTCMVQTGSVPRIWAESLIIPSNRHNEYKSSVFAPYDQDSTQNEAEQTPALLDVLLENECIVDFNQAVLANTSKKHVFSNLLSNDGFSGNFCDGMAFFPGELSSEINTLNRDSHGAEKVLYKTRKNAEKTQQQQQQQIYNISSTASSSSYSSINSTQTSSQNASLSTQEEHISDSHSMGLIVQQQKPVIGVISSPPPLKTMDDLSRMPPMQAIHILKLQMKLSSILGSTLPAALIPTAIQRVIPHDVRIDLVPGAAIRDRMILFQGYYNIDECFQLLTQNTVFLGGDVHDIRKWSFAPQYTSKFWFICHVYEGCGYDDSLGKKRADFIVNEYTKTNNDAGYGSAVY